MLFSSLFSNVSLFLCFQMVRHLKEKCPGRTKFLHTASSVHPLRWDHLQPSPRSRPPLKPNPTGTLAQPLQLPCSSSFLSRTPRLRPFSNTRTLPLLRTRRFKDSLLQPGPRTRHSSLLLKHRQGSSHLFPQLLATSLKTRTSGFPAEPPTHLRSLSEAAPPTPPQSVLGGGWQTLQREEQRTHRRDVLFTGS